MYITETPFYNKCIQGFVMITADKSDDRIILYCAADLSGAQYNLKQREGARPTAGRRQCQVINKEGGHLLRKWM